MRRVTVVLLSLMMIMMFMIPAAFADTVYKSSYAVAGFPSGVGTSVSTGSDYGVYGGLILGEVSIDDISQVSVSGSYDSSTGDYIVTYHVELVDALPITFDVTKPLFFVSIDTPTGVSLYMRSCYKTTRWTACDGDILYWFSNRRLVLPFESSSTYAADTGCYAIPITGYSFLGNAADFQIRISDPMAVVQLEGSERFLDTILYPFTLIADNSVVITFISSIWRAPLVTPFFTLALSGLAIGLIVKFMR